MAKPDEDLGQEVEPLGLLVRDQDAETTRFPSARVHTKGVMTAGIPTRIIAAGHEPLQPEEEARMASKQHLVLAFFESEDLADGAADALKGWAKANSRARLAAVGVLVKDADGTVKTHKLGPREAKKGIGIGTVLGVVGAAASGGVTLLEGVAVGGAGGGLIGSLFHKGLGMTEEDIARITSRLDDGHAAVGALVPANQADAVSVELESLGGEPEVHEISPEAVPEVSASVAPQT